MKGLHGTPQDILWDMKEKHGLTEPQIIGAILLAIDRATLDAAVKHGSDGVAARRKRSNIRRRPRVSRYDFGSLIGCADGRVYQCDEFKVTPMWIVENARGFAKRWNCALSYDVADDRRSVRIWLASNTEVSTAGTTY